MSRDATGRHCCLTWRVVALVRGVLHRQQVPRLVRGQRLQRGQQVRHLARGWRPLVGRHVRGAGRRPSCRNKIK